MPRSNRLLSNWINSYLEFTSNTEAPQIYHKWTALSCIASALERKVNLPWGHNTLYPNLYVLLIGPSGGGKSTAMNIGRSLLEELNLKLTGEDNSEEAIIRDIASAGANRTYFTPDEPDIERTQSAITCLAEEFAVFAGQQNTRMLAYLTNWYDCRDSWKRSTKHQGIDDIKNMCFNLLGAMSFDWIPHVLTQEAIGGGFTSRVVFVVADKKEKLIPNPNDLTIDLELRHKLVRDLEVIHNIAGTVTLDPMAQSFYEGWYIDNEAEMDKGGGPLSAPEFQGYNSRREMLIKKLAIILSIAENDDLIVSDRHLSAGLELMKETEVDLPRVFAKVGRNRYIGEVDNILRYVETRGTVTKAELMRVFYRDLSDFDMENVLKIIVTMNIVQVSIVPGKETIYSYNSEPNLRLVK